MRKIIRPIFFGLLLLSNFSCRKAGNIVYVIDINRSGKDAILNLPNSVNNYGNETELNIYCDTINGIKYINRAALYFDLTRVPQNAKIDSVFLQLYFNDKSGFYKIKKSGHSGNTILIVENIEEPWNEDSITWKKYPKIGPKKLNFEPHKVTDQDFRLNVTNLFVSSNKKLKKTHGLLVRLASEEIGNYIHVCSRESKKINSSPKLKIYANK
ncbi:DNRLRE domain-containing protein [Spongiivirga citrea]|uniref:DNRLRE domain-containing protein n=1 Tax=Spongiivirga citrea TaxID=1481457 RepID=A0A6M0CMM4_9FLAO|nr:DNRLRE domain-containing protein [Spongiivirga citrea]NER18912.1 DNRLRE domain-containing protein [Spongiivirga citrea]